MRKVRTLGAISLNPGSLKLFAWTRDFNPSVQNNTSAQVWVRFYRLAQEYWRLLILFAIASCVCTPICMDVAASKSRMDRTFGKFVRVLIDMDLTRTLNHNVLVEREGFTFFSDIEYENLPEFYSHCRKTGHVVQNCKMLRSPNNHSAPNPQEPPLQKKNAPESTHFDKGVSQHDKDVRLDVVADDGENTPKNSLKNQDLVVVVSEAKTLKNGLVDGDPILVPNNSLNFVTHPSRQNDSQLSDFVDATQDFVPNSNEGVEFLQKSRANLVEEDEHVEGAFTHAVSVLNKKKHSTRVKKKQPSRSQAGPKIVSS
ncbi:uncharacterized protein LOC131658450 [Vicia villosa]|uniref:uncharacterized protein LOC131658450 n=1 Tax=Vicia villosa TaxID=3911 RepID=UPI00273C5261|nr:uncharacterized protein LOC131658450 [Vicia villosa]